MNQLEKQSTASESSLSREVRYRTSAAVQLARDMGDKEFARQVAELASRPGPEAFELFVAVFPGSREVIIEIAEGMMHRDSLSMQVEQP